MASSPNRQKTNGGLERNYYSYKREDFKGQLVNNIFSL